MGKKKEYEEKQQHGTAEIPLGFHKMTYPEGTDVIFYLHWHQEFEILLVTEGEILFVIEERQYHLKKGDIVFINSNFLHSARTLKQHKCSFFAMDFSYQMLHEEIHSRFARKYIVPILKGNIILPEHIVQREKNVFPDQKIESGSKEDLEQEPWNQLSWQEQILYMMKELYQCPEHDVESCELLVRSRVFALWNLLLKNGVRVSGKDSDDRKVASRLQPVIKYMKENYAYEMNLSELAALIPMSEGQFCRVFKQNMKLSPMQYLMRYRILQSCRLLLETDKKIGEIANLSGFNNISYFNKVFLQTIGCTPKEYRNNSNY